MYDDCYDIKPEECTSLWACDCEMCGTCGSTIYSCNCGWSGCFSDDNAEARMHAATHAEQENA